jgi:membrane fusion protein (multidrug efflux system)
VTANFKETQVSNLRPGLKAVVTVDAYDGRKFAGHVESIAAATGARFSLLPPENATGNFVKVVQRVPVRIKVEQSPGQPQLRAGMTVSVAVDTGRPRGLPRVVQKLIDNGWLPRFLAPASALAGTRR